MVWYLGWERVIAKQLCEHIHSHGLDNSHQSAYKAGHSSLADRFVLFFDDKIKKIREKFKPIKLPSALVPSSIPPKFNSFSPISEGEVEKIILNSPTKSCLIDPLPKFLVKECLDLLLPSITKLVNYSLSESLVPAGCKNAVVTPLIKKPSLLVEDLKNYRPVSGLGFSSKLIKNVWLQSSYVNIFILIL